MNGTTTRPRRLIGVAVLVAAMVATVFVGVPLANSADATGCQGRAASFDSSGDIVDRVQAPGKGGTESDPFNIDPEGSVEWAGSTDSVITTGSWSVSTVGFSRSGDLTNEEGKKAAAGTVDIGGDIWTASVAKVLLSGKTVYKVTANVTGDGGSCTGTAYITGVGDPAFTPLWLIGLVLMVIGTAALLLAIVGTRSIAVASAAVGAGSPTSPSKPPATKN